jgi:hypothetical protein
MTGLPDYNYPAFFSVAELLERSGYEVLNPATECECWDGEYATYIKCGLKKLMKAEGVALLPGWSGSRGAMLEVQVASTLEMPVRLFGEWLVESASFDLLTSGQAVFPTASGGEMKLDFDLG